MMDKELQKSVVTKDKVSFMEAITVGQGAPVMLRMTKKQWLEMDSPDVITVNVSKKFL